MNLKEKTRMSREPDKFTLHKEGIFYKCYNEDAMVFAKRIKPYKVTSKYIKSASAEVLSLGFPVSEADRGSLTFEMLTETLGAVKYEIDTERVTFYLKKDIKQGFESWRDDVVKENAAQFVTKPNIKINGLNQTCNTDLIALINNFDLANSTPMQGLNFIQQLKKEVYKIVDSDGNI